MNTCKLSSVLRRGCYSYMCNLEPQEQSSCPVLVRTNLDQSLAIAQTRRIRVWLFASPPLWFHSQDVEDRRPRLDCSENTSLSCSRRMSAIDGFPLWEHY